MIRVGKAARFHAEEPNASGAANAINTPTAPHSCAQIAAGHAKESTVARDGIPTALTSHTAEAAPRSLSQVVASKQEKRARRGKKVGDILRKGGKKEARKRSAFLQA